MFIEPDCWLEIYQKVRSVSPLFPTFLHQRPPLYTTCCPISSFLVCNCLMYRKSLYWVCSYAASRSGKSSPAGVAGAAGSCETHKRAGFAHWSPTHLWAGRTPLASGTIKGGTRAAWWNTPRRYQGSPHQIRNETFIRYHLILWWQVVFILEIRSKEQWMSSKIVN